MGRHVVLRRTHPLMIRHHYQLAIDAGLNAYAAPLGMLEAGADSYAGAIPTILKLNSSNSHSTNKDQAVYGSACRRATSWMRGHRVYDLSRLEDQFEMMEEFRELAEEAKAVGLAVVLGPTRGAVISRRTVRPIDVCAYAAHLAAELGAHIIKVKPPTDHIEQDDARKVYEAEGIDIGSLPKRIEHVVQSSFNGRRLVVFSGGSARGTDGLLNEIREIRDGGAAARLSVAIPSNARRRKRSSCSIRLSTFTKARLTAARRCPKTRLRNSI